MSQKIKYEKMVQMQKNNSTEMADHVIKILYETYNEGKEISVLQIAKRAEVSRDFMYKNKRVREEINKLREKKIKETHRPDQGIFAYAKGVTVEHLQKDVAELKKENEKLQNMIKELYEEQGYYLDSIGHLNEQLDEYRNRGYVLD